MLKNYVPRSNHIETEYSLEFFRDRNGGCAFPCDENGNLLPFACEAAKKNYEYCMNHPEEYTYSFNRVRKESYRVSDPAHGTCECGEEVYLYNQYMGACECPNCGRWYNLFGQELIRPEYWED